MMFMQRMAAATMIVVLAAFPLARERCRTACVTSAAEITRTAPAAHACHEASSDDTSGARVDPISRACSHGDEAHVYEFSGLAAAQTRTAVLLPVLTASPPYLPEAVGAATAHVPLYRAILPHSLL